MKKLTIEETKEINGGVSKTKFHITYWSAFCDYCGAEWVALGPISGKAAAIEKAHLCELRDAESWVNY